MVLNPSLITAEGLSHVGLKRAHNEDCFFVHTKAGLLAIADGMGGHAGGEKASLLAIETLKSSLLPALRKKQTLDPQTSCKLLRDAFQKASRMVFLESLKTPALKGMGTTLTACLFIHNQAIIGHVGDSRIYLFRNKTLSQISQDHSLVQEQINAGLLSSQEAHQSPYRNVITRSIGFALEVNTDLSIVPILPYDHFLLCTDGLTNLVSKEEIEQLLSENRSLKETAHRLIQLSNEKGGDDNITVILAKVPASIPGDRFS